KVAGGDIPKDRIIDGKDLTPFMFQEKGATPPHASLYFYENFNLVAVREGKWKLVLPGAGPKAKKAPKQPELYDLEADLSETMNVAATNAETVAQLQRVAEAARDDL